MAGLKISLLNSASTLSPQDQIPIARNGVTLRLPGEAIASRPQLNALAEYAATKAPIISAEHIYTLIGGLSSSIDASSEYAADTYAPFTFVLDVSSFIDSRFITNLSATNTYIETPSAPSQGQVLTWDDGKWVPRIGVQAVVQSLSGARTLDIASVGTIIGVVGNNPPYGYLLCDGSSVSKLNYPELFQQIGYTYGGVAPGNSFNLPSIPQTTERPYLSYIKYTQISGLASVTAATSGLISKPTTNLQEGTVLTYTSGSWVAAAPSVPVFPVVESPFKRVYGRTILTSSPVNLIRATDIRIPANTWKITIALNRVHTTNGGTVLYMQLANEDGLINNAQSYISSSTANISQGFNVPSAITTLGYFYALIGATVSQNVTIKVPQSTGGKRPRTVYVDKVITESRWLTDSDAVITLVRTGGSTVADSHWVMSHTGRLAQYSTHGAGNFKNFTGKDITGLQLSVPTSLTTGTIDVYCETMPM
jgi:hypothetical protein